MSSATVNRITAWTVFAVALIVFFITVSPTVAFWDSGEFLTCSRILGIPHPPGSPLLSLVGRVASIIPVSDFRWSGSYDPVSFRINLINVIAGAFAVYLLYTIIVALLTRMYPFTGSLRRDWTIMAAAAIASLTAALSNQFWANAVETETYMSSILLSMLAARLALLWADKKDESRSVRYLFLAAYLIGLGNGIHLYSFLITPTIVLLVFFEKPSWFDDARFWMGLAVVLVLGAAIRYVGGKGAFFVLAMAFGFGAPVLLWRMNRGHSERWKSALFGILLCSSLYFIGYSVYPTIMVRAAKNPTINEGNPDNWTRFRYYLERRQYGQGNMYAGMFNRKAEPGYQFGFMFFRYMLQQAPKWGPSPVVTFTNDRSADVPDRPVEVKHDVPVSILFWVILCAGLALHLWRDPKRWLAFFLYFLAASVGLILYLNMANPEVRERDYFFIGAFYIMFVWFGIGMHALLKMLSGFLEKRKQQALVLPATAVMTILFATIVPASLISDHLDPGNSNFKVHDRSHNMIPLEYGINILDSSEPNAILFTHGDNDTYPVWYAREVLGMRKDVRIVNLSLLNAPWYIKQLRDDEPKVPITLTDDFIDNRLCTEDDRTFEVRQWSGTPRTVTMAGLTWDMPPTTQDPRNPSVGYLSISSYMTAHIIKTNDWAKPIQFAVTVNPRVLLGLDSYMKTQGMVFLLTKDRVMGQYGHDIPTLEKNIYERYRFTGVTDSTVYKDEETVGLLQNYFVGFADLCIAYMLKGDTENARKAARTALEKTIPDLNRRIILCKMLREGGIPDESDRMVDSEIAKLDFNDVKQTVAVGTRFLEHSANEGALRIFTTLAERHPDDALAMKAYTAALFQSGKYQEASDALDRVLKLVPGDSEALQLKRILSERLKNR